MAARLRAVADPTISPTVHQIFSGPVDGDALLVLDQNSAAILKELLTDEPALPARDRPVCARSDHGDRQQLLNACLGTFGNLLKVQVTFSVPT
jgi:chemotaxis protein CheC